MQVRHFVIAIVLLGFLAPSAAASDWVNTTYYNYMHSWADKSTFKTCESFTQHTKYRQTYTGYSRVAGYNGGSRVWDSGAVHTAANTYRQVNVGTSAPCSAGTYTYKAFVVASTAIPTASYYNGYSTFDFTVVGNPATPSVSVNPSTSGWTSDTTPVWSWSSSAAYGSITTYEVDRNFGSTYQTTSKSAAPTLDSGTWQLRVRALSNVGVWSGWSGWSVVRIDVDAPAAPTLSGPGSAWSNDVTPTFTWNAPADAGSGVARYDGQLNGATSNIGTSRTYTPTLSTGTHTFRVRAIDGAGNAGAWSNTLTVNIDASGPSGPTLSGPGSAWRTDPTASFTWTAPSESGSGLARYDGNLDGVIFNLGTATSFTTTMDDGTHTMRVRGIDNVGNIGAWSATQTVRVDTVAPGTPNLDGGLAAWSPQSLRSFSWNDPGDATSGIARYEGEIDGIPVNLATSSTYSAAFDDGMHSLRVRAVDEAGNVGDWSNMAEAWVDTVAPETLLELGEPTFVEDGLTYVSSGTMVTLTAEDATSDASIVESRLDGGAWVPRTEAFPVEAGDGEHTLEYRATDHAGNVESTQSIQLFVDSTAPMVTLLSPEEGRAYANGFTAPTSDGSTRIAGTITLSADAADEGVGLLHVAFYLDDELIEKLTDWPYQTQWDSSDASAGEHVLKVVALDRVGNAKADTRTVTIVPESDRGIIGTLPEPPVIPEVPTFPPEGFPDQPEVPTPPGGFPEVPEVPTPPEGLPEPPETPTLPPDDLPVSPEDVPDPVGLVPEPPTAPGLRPDVAVTLVPDIQNISIGIRIGVWIDDTFYGIDETLP